MIYHINFFRYSWPWWVKTKLAKSMCIPLELPEVNVTQVLESYGEISGQFFVKKRMYDVVYKDGTRVYQFRKLLKDIPKHIQIMGNRVKVIYTGQKKEVRVRREKVNVVANKNNINEATCSKNSDIIDLGKAIQKKYATLVIEIYDTKQQAVMMKLV